MKAIVCDKCGKVVLLSEDEMYPYTGIKQLHLHTYNRDIELCDECADELIAAIRKGE